eukprot:1018323-Rhodomonas_salina.2
MPVIGWKDFPTLKCAGPVRTRAEPPPTSLPTRAGPPVAPRSCLGIHRLSSSSISAPDLFVNFIRVHRCALPVSVNLEHFAPTKLTKRWGAEIEVTEARRGRNRVKLLVPVLPVVVLQYQSEFLAVDTADRLFVMERSFEQPAAQLGGCAGHAYCIRVANLGMPLRLGGCALWKRLYLLCNYYNCNLVQVSERFVPMSLKAGCHYFKLLGAPLSAKSWGRCGTVDPAPPALSFYVFRCIRLYCENRPERSSCTAFCSTAEGDVTP